MHCNHRSQTANIMLRLPTCSVLVSRSPVIIEWRKGHYYGKFWAYSMVPRTQLAHVKVRTSIPTAKMPST